MEQRMSPTSAGRPESRAVMTIGETSEFLRIRSSVVAAAASRGELPLIRRDGVALVDRMSLLKLLGRPAQHEEDH